MTRPARDSGDGSPAFSRRTFLIVAAGAVAVAAAGGGVVLRTGWAEERWIGALLRSSLPDATIPDREIRAFVQVATRDFGARHRLLATYRILLPDWRLPLASLEGRLVRLERQLLTDFMVGSDVFAIERASTPVTYHGPTVCNPLARFDAA